MGSADQPLAVLEPAFANALRDPQAPSRPGPPRWVLVNRADLLELPPPLLLEAVISQGATPQLDRAVKLMRQELAGDEDPLGAQALSTSPSGDIGPEAVACCFQGPPPSIRAAPERASPAAAGETRPRPERSPCRR